MPYSLEFLEKQGSTLHRQDIFETRRALKEVAEEFSTATAALNRTAIDPSTLTAWLELYHPEHSHRLSNPPKWVKAQLEGLETGGDKTRDEFVHVDYGFWMTGTDLDFLDPPVTPHSQHPSTSIQQNGHATFGTTKERSPTASQRYTYHTHLVEWFIGHGFSEIPSVPQGDRPLEMLLCNDNVWNMSRRERSTLCKYWESEARAYIHHSHLAIIDDLRQRHAKLQADLDAYNAEVGIVLLDLFLTHDSRPFQTRLSLLQELNIICSTTTSAAKQIRLLKVWKAPPYFKPIV